WRGWSPQGTGRKYQGEQEQHKDAATRSRHCSAYLRVRSTDVWNALYLLSLEARLRAESAPWYGIIYRFSTRKYRRVSWPIERKPHGLGDTGTTRTDGREYQRQDLWPGPCAHQCPRARADPPGCRGPCASRDHPSFLQSVGPRAPDGRIPGRTSPETCGGNPGLAGGGLR